MHVCIYMQVTTQLYTQCDQQPTTCKLHNTMNASGQWVCCSTAQQCLAGCTARTMCHQDALAQTHRHNQPARQQLCESTALLRTTVPVRAHMPTGSLTHSAGIGSLSLLWRHHTPQHKHTLTHPSLLPRGIKPPSRFLSHKLQNPGCVASTTRLKGFINPLEVRGTLALHQD